MKGPVAAGVVAVGREGDAVEAVATISSPERQALGAIPRRHRPPQQVLIRPPQKLTAAHFRVKSVDRTLLEHSFACKENPLAAPPVAR